MKLEEHDKSYKIPDSKQQCLATNSQLNVSQHDLMDKEEENASIGNQIRPLKSAYKSGSSSCEPHQGTLLCTNATDIAIK